MEMCAGCCGSICSQRRLPRGSSLKRSPEGEGIGQWVVVGGQHGLGKDWMNSLLSSFIPQVVLMACYVSGTVLSGGDMMINKEIRSLHTRSSGSNVAVRWSLRL